MENLDDQRIFTQTKKLMAIQFSENSEQLSRIEDWEGLEETLTKTLNYLLDHDLSSLLSILYRIDVSEQVVKSVLSLTQPDQVASQLAKSIVLRLKQKSISRLRYG